MTRRWALRARRILLGRHLDLALVDAVDDVVGGLAVNGWRRGRSSQQCSLRGLYRREGAIVRALALMPARSTPATCLQLAACCIWRH
jgi:hypothetical protein